eukprot:1191169-Prorocentrum_minimum.AAC.5
MRIYPPVLRPIGLAGGGAFLPKRKAAMTAAGLRTVVIPSEAKPPKSPTMKRSSSSQMSDTSSQPDPLEESPRGFAPSPSLPPKAGIASSGKCQEGVRRGSGGGRAPAK